MGITGKELAAMLGISEAAVSMALNNKSGAIISDNPFFSQLTEGVSTACEKEGYYLNIQYLYDQNDIGRKVSDFITTGCKGLVLLGTEMQKADLLRFNNIKIPLVILDCYFADYSANYILINNMQGSYIATDYLFRKSHTQPGYLRSSYPIQNFMERADGFYKAIRDNGMSTSRSIVHTVAPSVEGTYSDLMTIIQNKDALAKCYFADNDLIAAGAIKAFKESGYKIPKDIQVIGFDDIALCTCVEPAISTIHVPKEHMGRVAAKRLFELIGDPKQITTKIEVETKLIIRSSTK